MCTTGTDTALRWIRQRMCRTRAVVAVASVCYAAISTFGAARATEVEETAAAILDRVATRYRNAHSYSFEGQAHITVRVLSESEGAAFNQEMDIPIRLQGIRPDRFRLDIDHPAAGSIVVSDGTATWIYAQQLHQYMERASAARGAGSEGYPGAGSEVFGAVALFLSSREEAKALYHSARMLEPDELKREGKLIPCHRIAVGWRKPYRVGEQTFADTLWIAVDRATVVQQRSYQETTMSIGTLVSRNLITVQESRIDEAVPEAAFRFVPPPGARKVGRLSMAGAAPPDLSGQPAPQFQLENLSGRKVELKAAAGKVVLLDFWATWCRPCRAALEATEALRRRYGADKLVVLTVNNEPRDRASAFIKENGYGFEVLTDPTESVFDKYQVKALPTTVVINPSGIVVAHFVGLTDEDTLVRALLAAGIEP